MELFPRESPGDAADPTPARSAEAPGRARDRGSSEAPLPERLRPERLDEFSGQAHLLSAGGPLGPVVSGTGRLTSSIFWGPPGSGKTTLARLLARHAGMRFVTLSAVQAGVKEVRQAIEIAQTYQRSGKTTALFVDEIHRFNKAQQDALLPHVERGTVVLLGATTENPSFEVIPALRSRCRIFTLHAHASEDLEAILARALADRERGLPYPAELEPDARELLIRLASGDARRALQLLEHAAEQSRGAGAANANEPASPGQTVRIDRAAVEAALETRLPDYDKAGDAHYDVISAFIKSMRGSDPDAAIYWLARMLEGGEDPRFICRRMMIFASEDIGNADPHALPLAVAAAEAFERLGLPEGRIPIAQAATYLASAPKSNASYRSLGAATDAVRHHGALAVPKHLRNAPTALMRREGFGKGYQYPHDHSGHFVREQYRPDAVASERYYLPSDQGAEAEIAARLDALWRGEEGD